MIDVLRKKYGAYYTPDDVAKTLVNWVIRQSSDQLLDPACGDGRFLVHHRFCTGIEQDSPALHRAKQIVPWAVFHNGDFFEWANTTEKRFDCAAGNPPFIRYQCFTGKVRENANELCKKLGVRFSMLSSSWALFLVAISSLLKPGGRMAFVVPAEIGHAPYARPLIFYLAGHFNKLQLIPIRRKIFPELSEDVWLLYAEGYGENTNNILFSPCAEFRSLSHPPTNCNSISLIDWEKSNFRLRSFLIKASTRELYEHLANKLSADRLGDLAHVGIGYVTGANEFFHLRPSEARQSHISQRYLQATVRNGRCLPPNKLTSRTVKNWMERDEPIFLLRLLRGQKLSLSVLKYLNTPAAEIARHTYKCRHRNPWYVVPDVCIPDAFLTYMNGKSPSLVANSGGCACTNSIHAVRLKKGESLSDIQIRWRHPLAQLSCEIEGHPLGGGMLKIEPGEAARILIPQRQLKISKADLHCINEGIETLKKWRHYE